jgi:hypothetical protein
MRAAAKAPVRHTAISVLRLTPLNRPRACAIYLEAFIPDS